MPSEFELIARYFTRAPVQAELGVGDDAALLRPTPGRALAVSSDMLVAGRHFFADADARLLGHKALAVNLSDLAAMGARPRWALLALALPTADETWLAAFSEGFHALAGKHAVDLVGGDTTCGPLNLCVTVLGEVGAQALRRDAARAGDDIWVSGELGGAALGLAHLRGDIALEGEHRADCLLRLHAPTPRVELGLRLAELPRVAAIDVSDGLLADLGHVLTRSGVAAELSLPAVPAHVAVAARLTRQPAADGQALRCLLAGGDDYELCFTAPPRARAAVQAAGVAAGVSVTRVGRVVAGAGLRVLDERGAEMSIDVHGYDHFAA
jgi:thiamine-monophosphate kinase